jgi:hypothetical protein
MDNAPEILVLKFADSKIPVFKETRNKDYIKYGDDNKYPDYLNYLFNKSAKHNAIVTGKSSYIFGKGFENGNVKVNRLGETLNDISKKAILDIEIYGGFRYEIIWNRGGKISEIYHVDFSSIRKGKTEGYYYKDCWDAGNRDEEVFINEFDPSNPIGNQIFAYNEYRPMVRYYPLPAYIGCNNFIETDIEISKYYLSAIRNGMAPSKMIQFFKGEPSEDKKREIERRFTNKFTGAENAGRFILVFNDANATQEVKIDDLSGSDLDKMFVELNKTCQQEIFSGHLVTSPMLFGIKTEGQLGGNTELQTSYSIFQNTYSKPKAESFSKEIQYLLSFSNYVAEYELQPTDPIGWVIPDESLKAALTPDEVREKLGLPVLEKPQDSPITKTLNALTSISPLVATKILDNLTKNEIRSLASLPPVADGDVIPNADGTIPARIEDPTLDSDLPVNEHLKNLTGRQMQGIQRIIRKYQNPDDSMTYEMAKALLKSGYGFTDDDIIIFLGQPPVVPIAMSSHTEEDILSMFDACGESKRDYEILKSKMVAFSAFECEDDEEVFIQEAFKSYDVTTSENEILELIKKDKKITPAVIAETIGETEAYVKSKISALVKKGYLEEKVITVGEDEVIERTIPEKVSAPPVRKGEVNPTRIFIKYSYEVKPGIGPEIIPTTRPFCRKMIGLNRLYSRADIEKISARLGYSVFDRKGGFWGHKPECRHRWVSHIVVKKES